MRTYELEVVEEGVLLLVKAVVVMATVDVATTGSDFTVVAAEDADIVDDAVVVVTI